MIMSANKLVIPRASTPTTKNLILFDENQIPMLQWIKSHLRALCLTMVVTLGTTAGSVGGQASESVKIEAVGPPATAKLVSKQTYPQSANESAQKKDPNTEKQELPLRVVWLELSQVIRDAPPPFAWVTSKGIGLTIRDIIKLLEKVANDERYLGVVLNLDRLMLGLSQINEISAAVDAVRASGKHVMAFAEQYCFSSYLLASSADTILLHRKGLVELTGMSLEEMYLLGLFEKLGIKADFVQVGKYKGFDEAWTRSQPSEAWNLNIDALIDDLYGQIVERIADRRMMSHEEVEQLFADSLAMSETDYLERRVIDQIVDRDLIEATKLVYGDHFVWEKAEPVCNDHNNRYDSPFAVFSLLLQESTIHIRRNSLAVIHARGVIHSGRSGCKYPFFGGESIGSSSLLETLGDIGDNDLVKGAVIHLDSPGGSAIASEVLWQAVQKVGRKKPVFVSVGALAASGGYYIACAANEIYVAPHSIIGSIGVGGGKVTLGSLYEKIGVSVHRRSRGALGDMFNSVNTFTPNERAMLQTILQRIYEQFTERVVLGRGNRVSDIDAIAQGRLFTGRQAVKNGMADHIGNLENALVAMAEQLGLKEGEYDVVRMPPPISLSEYLENLFNSQIHVSAAQTGLIQTVRELLGSKTWPAAQAVLNGLMLLRNEPVLTLMPYVIVAE